MSRNKTIDKTVDRTIGAFIEETRKKYGITQQQLADHVGITSVYYRDIIKGMYRPTWTIFVNICLALNININEIITKYAGRVNTLEKAKDPIPDPLVTNNG